MPNYFLPKILHICISNKLHLEFEFLSSSDKSESENLAFQYICVEQKYILIFTLTKKKQETEIRKLLQMLYRSYKMSNNARKNH